MLRAKYPHQAKDNDSTERECYPYGIQIDYENMRICFFNRNHKYLKKSSNSSAWYQISEDNVTQLKSLIERSNSHLFQDNRWYLYGDADKLFDNYENINKFYKKVWEPLEDFFRTNNILDSLWFNWCDIYQEIRD